MKGKILPVGINHIINNQVPSTSRLCRNNTAFKSLPNDSVEISSKKNELSNGAKVGIGLGVAALIALGVELIWGKGKHLKALWERIFGGGGKKPPKTPEGSKGIKEGEQPKPTGTSTTAPIGAFRSVSDARAWFEKFGIRAEIRDVEKADLEYINQVAKDLVELDKLGVAASKPDSIIISDWRKIDELSNLYRERNIVPDIETLRSCTGYWGRAVRGTDNTVHVFLNSNKLGVINSQHIIQHEIGHHCRALNDSVLAKKLNDLDNLGSKKLEILGYKPNIVQKGIFEYAGGEYCSTVNGGEFASALTSDGLHRVNQPVLSGKGITDLFNREVRKGYSYSDYEADEYVADIFKGLTTGQTFSDEVMLAYDFIGGGRVPNLKIKGKSYDEYITSLYEDPVQIQKLRDKIKLKIVRKNTDGQVTLEECNESVKAAAMRD